jgi:hypothetical protein
MVGAGSVTSASLVRGYGMLIKYVLGRMASWEGTVGTAIGTAMGTPAGIRSCSQGTTAAGTKAGFGGSRRVAT